MRVTRLGEGEFVFVAALLRKYGTEVEKGIFQMKIPLADLVSIPKEARIIQVGFTDERAILLQLTGVD